MRGFDPGTSAPEFSICIAHRRGPVIAVKVREGWFDAATDWLVPEGRPFDAVTLLEDVVVAVASDGHRAPRWSGSSKELRQRAWV